MDTDERIDINEDHLYHFSDYILRILLLDRTTRKNIIWATDDYSALGEAYGVENEITIESITGDNWNIIRPRVLKSEAAQDARTKEKAEVFTPCWVCNAQNNLVDEQWFGRKNVFNQERENGWVANTEKIAFPDDKHHSWKAYVDARRMEISCGEAPYLVSRYDTVSGNIIPVEQRIGLLDRKLRVVDENTEDMQQWLFWAKRAVQSVYGFEYQGDSLLLARESVLYTFIDYYKKRFVQEPEQKVLREISKIISWNLWQMDGLKTVVPFSCKPIVNTEYSLFGEITTVEPCPGCQGNDNSRHTGSYCKLYDWRRDNALRYYDLIGGKKHGRK